jgi:hypothetical protein
MIWGPRLIDAFRSHESDKLNSRKLQRSLYCGRLVFLKQPFFAGIT